MASLYDDIEVDTKDKGLADGPIDNAKKINLAFLKSQLEAKRAVLQNSQKLSSLLPTNVTIELASTSGGNAQQKKSLLNLKPRRALPLSIDSTSTFTIVPKALKEDKVFLFGEILVEDEYNPTAPTDYSSYKQKREAQKMKEKTAKEIAERLQKQYAEEEEKRRSGVAIAPPQVLMEQAPATSVDSSPTDRFEPPKQFGRAGSRGLGVAANIMQKMGYREGFGLGRSEQGISRALKVERTGRNQGLIIIEGDERIQTSSTIEDNDGSEANQSTQQNETNITEMLKSATKIVILKNMVHPSEIDSELEGELLDEMKKYGQLNSVIIRKIPNVAIEEAVQIYLEFSNSAQAIKAVVDLNGRFFGGRPIKASFCPIDEYAKIKTDQLEAVLSD